MLTAIVNGFADAVTMKRRKTDDGLVRMFETEYKKDAHFAHKQGVKVDARFVTQFISDHRR